MKRINFFLAFILVINLAAITFGIWQYAKSNNALGTAAALQHVTEQRMGTYFVPIPNRAGEPYGDCKNNGQVVGYSVKETCSQKLGGNDWEADSIKKP